LHPHFNKGIAYYPHSSIINQQGESTFNLFPLPLSDDDKNHSDLSFDATSMGHSIDFDPLPSETIDTNMTYAPVSESGASYRCDSTCNRQPPSRLHDFVTYTVKHPVNNALTYHRLSSSHAAYLNAKSKRSISQNFHEVNQQKE